MQCIKFRILVIDFGSQYTQLLLRRIRELGVYSESCNWDINEDQLCQFNPSGIILSGSPYSVLDKKAPFIPRFIFDLNIPILGICYGMQVMTIQLGGSVCRSSLIQGEFGYSKVQLCSNSMLTDGIYDDIDNVGRCALDVWMSHRDIITIVPKDFIIVGMTESNKIAIIAHEKRRFYGLQFHPEVTHTKKGKNILRYFVIKICACKAIWKPINIIENIIHEIRSTVNNDKVVLAFSGGVDSFVTALLLKHALNNQFICIFINNGLLGSNELNRLNKFCKKYCELNIICVSEEKRFLKALINVTEPEEKRKVVGTMFMEIFKMKIRDLRDFQWLAQGTIYSDVIESGVSISSSTNLIKSHHNVGGLPNFVNIKLLEPIRFLFKDEVRKIGLSLGLSHDIAYRHPFPGPGLAIRIIGEVKKQYCDILRQADCIFFEELKKENLYDQIGQAFSVFLSIRSVGIQGDHRNYGWVIGLRAVETIDFMTARWARLPYDLLDKVSNRIVNEVRGVSRVVYDISCKPPATIEWE